MRYKKNTAMYNWSPCTFGYLTSPKTTQLSELIRNLLFSVTYFLFVIIVIIVLIVVIVIVIKVNIVIVIYVIIIR